MFVCLMFFVLLENFSLITGERLQILTYMYTRNSWSFSSEGSLAFHTYFDTGYLFIRFISAAAVITCFNDVGLLRPVLENPTFLVRGERSNRLRHSRIICYVVYMANIKGLILNSNRYFFLQPWTAILLSHSIGIMYQSNTQNVIEKRPNDYNSNVSWIYQILRSCENQGGHLRQSN